MDTDHKHRRTSLNSETDKTSATQLDIDCLKDTIKCAILYNIERNKTIQHVTVNWTYIVEDLYIQYCEESDLGNFYKMQLFF